MRYAEAHLAHNNNHVIVKVDNKILSVVGKHSVHNVVNVNSADFIVMKYKHNPVRIVCHMHFLAFHEHISGENTVRKNIFDEIRFIIFIVMHLADAPDSG